MTCLCFFSSPVPWDPAVFESSSKGLGAGESRREQERAGESRREQERAGESRGEQERAGKRRALLEGKGELADRYTSPNVSEQRILAPWV